MSFATPRAMSAHNATLTARSAASAMRSFEVMPVAPSWPGHHQAVDGVTLSLGRRVVKPNRWRQIGIWWK